MERKRRNRTHDLSNVKKRGEKALLVSRRFHLKIIVAVDCAARRQTSASCIKLRMRERERERGRGEEGEFLSSFSSGGSTLSARTWSRSRSDMPVPGNEGTF